jgi:hypothetical protein
MVQTNSSSPKINELVKGMLFNQHMTAVDLSNAMGWSYDSGYKLLKRSDWKISEMQAAGKLLKFNFFSLYADVPDVAGFNNAIKAKDSEIEAKNRKIEMLEMENKYLKEMVEIAKLKLKR